MRFRRSQRHSVLDAATGHPQDADDAATPGRLWRVADSLFREKLHGLNSDESLHCLFDQSPIAIVLLDGHGMVQAANAAFQAFGDRSQRTMLGMPFVDCVAFEDRDDVHLQLSQLILGTVHAINLDSVRLLAKGDNEVVVSLHAHGLGADEGLTGVIVHLVDITEQRHLERQYAQAQRLQAIGQLSGGIAHDFNNLLTVVLGFCDLLLARHGRADPSYDDILQIRANAARGSMLVRQLLTFSKRHPGKPVNLSIALALGELSGMLKRLLGEHIDFKIDICGDPLVVLIDPAQFDQVMINLAVNARDAMASGGTLTIRVRGVEFAHQIVRGGDTVPPGCYARIDFVDSGVGIPKEILGNIFDPFFTTKEDGGGTGLGLATVYGILKQRGGFIFVESAPGVGTRFEILLPSLVDLEPWEEPRAVPRDHPPHADGERIPWREHRTVLLVEDEDAVRLLAARGLRNRGFRVIEAVSGDQALAKLNERERAIHLIVSDIVMPGTDGISLARAARGMLPDVKVVLTSGYSDDLMVGEFRDDPNVRFLAKPFTLAELNQTACDMLTE